MFRVFTRSTINNVTVPPNHWQQLAFDECRRTIEDRLAQCYRLEAALRSGSRPSHQNH
jgi:hypothetical protein